MQKLVLLGVMLLAACGDDGNSSGIPDECNPLGGQGCMLPWPSAIYETTDATSVTGFRLAIPRTAMPSNIDGDIVEPDSLNRYDGFSLAGQMLAQFPTGVSAAGLPSFKNPDESLAASSPIALIDVDHGERAPFFAETDLNTDDPNKRALIVRPLARLKPGTRYVVAITNRVKAADGSDLPVPEAFAALRDGKSFDHPKFGDIAKRWPPLFDKLAAMGYPKSDLVLAWDFTTASDDFMRSDLTSMRTQTLAAVGPNGANLTFSVTSGGGGSTLPKHYLGTYKSPDFLTNGEADDSVLTRGADGMPMAHGMRDAQFAAIIPSCVATQPLPRPVIIFGHGLFGSAKEYLDDSFTQDLAEQHCFIIIAGDFIGLTSRQLALAPLAVNDMNKGRWISEKLAQSVMDFISLEHVTRNAMAKSDDFKINGQAVIDPNQTYYVGGSLGGIMGNVIMAYDPNLPKGLLAVPGGVWSMLFERSFAWFALKGSAQGAYPDPAMYQEMIAILGMAMEPYDPISTAAHVIKDPLFGQPAKKILMWYSMGDSLVTNISTEMIAREMGIPMIGPSAKTVWHLPVMEGPLDSGITVYNAHPTPLPPETNVPPDTDNGTHSGINKKPPPLRQVEKFLLENQAVDECKVNDQPVPCDCATAGACN